MTKQMLLEGSQEKKINLLVDWRVDNEKFWLQEKLEQLGFNVEIYGIPDYSLKNYQVKWRKLILWWQYFLLGWRGAIAGRGLHAIVLSWGFIPGIFAAIISSLFGKHPHVIALNMIPFEKGYLHSFLRWFIYRLAFATNNILVTVNSAELRHQCINSYGIGADKISVLHDSWHPDYPILAPSRDDDGFVFSGGEAARDWETLLAVAQCCPTIPFKIIARRMYWKPMRAVPANVEVHFDTSKDTFFSMVSQSRIVLLPLKSTVTAGLIVLLNSILIGRLIIATRTPATIPYFPLDCQDLLTPMSAHVEISSALQYYWANSNTRINKTIALQNHVLSQFSPDTYAKQVSDLVIKASRLN